VTVALGALNQTWVEADDGDSKADVRALAQSAGVTDPEIIAVAG
jgi:hypothetical protein